MKSNFSRFLHITSSYSGLTRISRSNKFANCLDLDTPIKSECDTVGTNAATCHGRSMVEMLGVLAIIGVLSVGAIAGYSKAMMKYKLNKQAEQLTQILFSLEHYREMLGRDRNNIANQYSSVVPLLMKLNTIPSEMYKPDRYGYLRDVFGNLVNVTFYNDGVFGLVVYYQSDQQDVCNNVLQLIKYNSPKLYYTCVKTTNNGECTSPMLTNTNIDKVNQSDIYDYCNLCKTSGNCRISSQFSFD